MPTHYTDGSVLIGTGEQELASNLKALVRHTHAGKGEINYTKIQKHATLVNF